jgi:hypothetical protein
MINALVFDADIEKSVSDVSPQIVLFVKLYIFFRNKQRPKWLTYRNVVILELGQKPSINTPNNSETFTPNNGSVVNLVMVRPSPFRL